MIFTRMSRSNSNNSFSLADTRAIIRGIVICVRKNSREKISSREIGKKSQLHSMNIDFTQCCLKKKGSRSQQMINSKVEIGRNRINIPVRTNARNAIENHAISAAHSNAHQ